MILLVVNGGDLSHVIGPALWGHEHLKFIVLILVGGFEGIPCGAYAAVRGGLAL
jgi:hypothetical protein